MKYSVDLRVTDGWRLEISRGVGLFLYEKRSDCLHNATSDLDWDPRLIRLNFGFGLKMLTVNSVGFRRPFGRSGEV